MILNFDAHFTSILVGSDELSKLTELAKLAKLLSNNVEL